MNIKYIVKPENRMVIGICKVSNYEILTRLEKHLDPSIWNECRWGNVKFEHAYKEITLKAFATCDERDEFDENYGKKLVRAKLAYKVDKLAMEYAYEIRENLNKMLKNFDYNAFYRVITSVNNDKEDLREHYGLHIM